MQKDPFWAAWSDTAPEKLADMTSETLDAYYRFFVDRHPHLSGAVQESQRLAASGRIDLLHAEIERRRIEETNARHHDELINQGRKTFAVGENTLRWTKIAAWAAICGALAAIAALLLNMPLSKLLPSTSSQPSRAPLPQTTATVSP